MIRLMILGLISGLAFAPIFFLPSLLTLSYLIFEIFKANTYKQALYKGFIYGFGHFLASMYWMCIGIGVYIDEFWWAVPLALFGIPIILACFIALTCLSAYFFKNTNYFHFIFCLCWLFFEWLRSWLFTGLPWNLLGYSWCFSDYMIQVSSLFSIYGLSFITIYIATIPFFLLKKDCRSFYITAFIAIFLIFLSLTYGYQKLSSKAITYTDIKARLVQPSIAQTAKWTSEHFWTNLNNHLDLSLLPGDPDLIIWSEAATTLPYNQDLLYDELIQMLWTKKAILVSGGINDIEYSNGEYDLFSTLYGLDYNGQLAFEYRKAHLVPFGEYMPFKKFLPFKKLTDGLIDYAAGQRQLVRLDKFNLNILPLICYESIFSFEAITSNKLADVIINVTNDAWFGNSSGPYQHFHISRIRAIESGLPMLRVSNNGISAVIDSYGRILQQMPVNYRGIIDTFIPVKETLQTPYSKYGLEILYSLIAAVLIIQLSIEHLVKIRFFSQVKP